ncbi:Programmed cell death protein 2 [Mactra antiquata]
MAAPLMEKDVELGFVEETDKKLLTSRYFPSKIGGHPAWLSLDSLPTTDSLACRICKKPTSFLLQVYSPGAEQVEAFHRTIFVFVCTDPACNKSNTNDNFHVFRSQLPKVNKFYSAEPPDETLPGKDEINAASFNKICIVCGCLGPKTCSKCQSVSYCGKDHQTIDWKLGHKKSCTSKVKQEQEERLYPSLFPEMELVTETENYKPCDKTADKSEEEKMKEYKEYLCSQNSAEGLKDLSETELQKMASEESENDKQLRKFKKRLSHEPDQVLRYSKGGEPLWIACTPKPDNIPDCDCGSKRQFEFQVLPHMLSYLDVDKVGESLDWGVLCIYTCSKNCSIENTYHREYIYKQDVI